MGNATTDKAHIAFWLSQTLHRLGQQHNDLDHLREAVSFMQEVVAAKKPDRKFDDRFWLAKLALDSEQFDLARDVSNQMLSDNPENHQAVHVAHIVLGSLSFREEIQQISMAMCSRLRAASRSTNT